MSMEEAMKIASAYVSTIQRERIKGRRVVTTLQFNGHDISEKLQPYLIGVTFTDVAAGSSDAISIDLYDADMQWIKDWYPTKGDVITGGAIFKDWNYVGERLKLTYGRFILDSIKFSGGPLRCTFGGLAIPQDRSFKTRQRTKTWEGVTLSQIGKEIAGRYGLTCVYNAGDINIESLEQTDKTDSDFLASTVKDYGLKMKVYNKKIVILMPADWKQRARSARLPGRTLSGTAGTMTMSSRVLTPVRSSRINLTSPARTR